MSAHHPIVLLKAPIPLPRFELETLYQRQLGPLALHLFVNGMWQRLVATGGDETLDPLGIGYGGRAALGGFKLGFAGGWDRGGGMSVPLADLQIDPASVVTPGKVEPYVVIPSQDGLRLLVENGTLARTDHGYRLLKPLPRWPAGLAGSHAVTFILPKGIPMPAGSLSHSRVIQE